MDALYLVLIIAAVAVTGFIHCLVMILAFRIGNRKRRTQLGEVVAKLKEKSFAYFEPQASFEAQELMPGEISTVEVPPRFRQFIEGMKGLDED